MYNTWGHEVVTINVLTCFLYEEQKRKGDVFDCYKRTELRTVLIHVVSCNGIICLPHCNNVGMCKVLQKGSDMTEGTKEKPYATYKSSYIGNLCTAYVRYTETHFLVTLNRSSVHWSLLPFIQTIISNTICKRRHTKAFILGPKLRHYFRHKVNVYKLRMKESYQVMMEKIQTHVGNFNLVLFWVEYHFVDLYIAVRHDEVHSI
jgi:hypothetical protein